MEKKMRWDAGSAAEWDEILEAQVGSHLSAVKFCRDRDINYKQFLYVRGKIRKKRCQSLVVTQPSRIASSRGFIPISVVGAGSSVRVRLPHGFELMSDELPPATWVAEVSRCLAGEGDEP